MEGYKFIGSMAAADVLPLIEGMVCTYGVQGEQALARAISLNDWVHVYSYTGYISIENYAGHEISEYAPMTKDGSTPL